MSLDEITVNTTDYDGNELEKLTEDLFEQENKSNDDKMENKSESNNLFENTSNLTPQLNKSGSFLSTRKGSSSG